RRARHSGEGGTNSETKVQSPHTGGGGGSVSEARVQSSKSGGGDYGQNYAAPSSSAAMSLPMYSCHIPREVIWTPIPQQA
ncbi:hypothetical protein Tco_0085935, partial [Tanacetum coccineum]